VAVRIIPFLVAILAAVGAFRGAGAMDALAKVLAPITGPLGCRRKSFHGARAAAVGLGALGSWATSSRLRASGLTRTPDDSARCCRARRRRPSTSSRLLRIRGIVRYRHALAAGLLADFTGLTASVTIARMLWA